MDVNLKLGAFFFNGHIFYGLYCLSGNWKIEKGDKKNYVNVIKSSWNPVRKNKAWVQVAPCLFFMLKPVALSIRRIGMSRINGKDEKEDSN